MVTATGEVKKSTGYKQYFAYLTPTYEYNYKIDYEVINQDLFLACDVSGWFWRYKSAWGNLNNRADQDDVYYINIGVNGGFHGFQTRIDCIKDLIKTMKISECPNLELKKKLGEYRFSSSSIRNTRYGKNHKATFEGYDDK